VAQPVGVGSYGGHPAARGEEEHRPLVQRSSDDARGVCAADREPKKSLGRGGCSDGPGCT
jgi:hypothetical protein